MSHNPVSLLSLAMSKSLNYNLFKNLNYPERVKRNLLLDFIKCDEKLYIPTQEEVNLLKKYNFHEMPSEFIVPMSELQLLIFNNCSSEYFNAAFPGPCTYSKVYAYRVIDSYNVNNRNYYCTFCVKSIPGEYIIRQDNFQVHDCLYEVIHDDFFNMGEPIICPQCNCRPLFFFTDPNPDVEDVITYYCNNSYEVLSTCA